MSNIPIHNETEFPLTAAILEQIRRDAVEYFGESVRAIRVQYGIDRHAFNAKTGEIRYAFSPGDFGLTDASVSSSSPYFGLDIPSIDDDTDTTDDMDDLGYEEAEEDEPEDAEVPLEALAGNFADDEDAENDEDSDDTDIDEFDHLNEPFDELDVDEKDYLYDEDYD